LSRRPGPFLLDDKVHIDLSPEAGRHDQLDRRIGLRVELDDDASGAALNILEQVRRLDGWHGSVAEKMLL
jgi:hypothetical protein